jgi:hypothetical protein
MENIEGWDPHPTWKNIYKNQKSGLLYILTQAIIYGVS